MWARFQDWLNAPYHPDRGMTALDWFWLVGLFLTILILWGFIMRHIEEGIS